MQKITLIGNIGKDAQVKESSSGRKFVTFTVAVNSFRNGEQKVSWYSITWFTYIPNMIQYLTKGNSVVVVGELDADIRIDNNTGASLISRNVVADSVQFTTFTNNKNNETSTGQTSSVRNDDEISTMTSRTQEEKKVSTKPQMVVEDEEDSDLPF